MGAVLRDGRLWDFVVARDADGPALGEIHLARVTRVVQAPAGAHIELVGGVAAFLRLPKGRPLHEGAHVVVQIEAEAHADKSVRVTIAPSVTGRLLVVTPGGSEVRFARRLGSDKDRLHATLGRLIRPGEGLLARSAAAPAAEGLLATELEQLRRRWAAVEAKAAAAAGPTLLDRGDGAVASIIRDFAVAAPIVIEGSDAIAAARAWTVSNAPDLMPHLVEHRGARPIFEELDIAAEIDAALDNELELPVHGRIIFESGQTLTAIDVNAAGGDARAVNRAAVDEIARQLRVRNISGAIVVDFIPLAASDRSGLLAAIKRATADDPEPVHVLGFSNLGLVELTRRRRRVSLAERMLEPASAGLRAEAVAFAAARAAAAARRSRSAAITLRAQPVVIEAFRASQGEAGVALMAECDWPRERFEVTSP